MEETLNHIFQPTVEKEYIPSTFGKLGIIGRSYNSVSFYNSASF